MFERIDLGDDTVGKVPVSIRGTEILIDLWEVNGALIDLLTKHQGETPTAWLRGVAGYLEELGFPPGTSLYMADRFARSVFDRVEAVKKAEAGGPTPGSPASTDSAPSA